MNLKVAISTFIEINPNELWQIFGTGFNLGIYLSMKLLLTWILEYVLYTCFPNISCIYSMQYCLSMLLQRKEDSLEYMELYAEVIKSFCCCKLRPVTWIWQCWNNLWCCFMIVQAISQMLKIAENIWLHRRPQALKTYYHLRSAKQHIKQARYQFIC